MAPLSFNSLLGKRQRLSDDDNYDNNCEFGNGNCGRSSWDSWGRWVALVVIVVFFILIAFLYTLLATRRRRRLGHQPMVRTGWMSGLRSHNNNNPPPAYNPHDPQQNLPVYGAGPYSGNNVELQQPQGVYQQPQGVHQQPIYQQPQGVYQAPYRGYEPPAGPPPARDEKV